MYKVITPRQQTEYPSRQDAVRAARKLSRRTHHSVRVMHDKGFERMTYRMGQLEEGVYITPDQRRRASRAY